MNAGFRSATESYLYSSYPRHYEPQHVIDSTVIPDHGAGFGVLSADRVDPIGNYLMLTRREAILWE